MKYYLGPWNQSIVDGELWFASPDGVCGLIDMRSIPGHIDQTYGFFCTPDDVTLDPTSYELLGIAPYIDQLVLTSQQKAMWSSMLGLGPVSSTSNALVDVLYESMTVLADPTGDTAVKNLMPTAAGNLDIHLGGHSLIYRKKFTLDLPEAANVIAQLQIQYRDLERGSRQGDIPQEHHRKVLDFWCEQYGVDSPDIFIPKGLPKVSRIPHETKFTESFNQPDSTILGPDLTWTETSGDSETFSNTWRPVSATNQFAEARAQSDVSSSNMYSQAVVSLGASVSTTTDIRVLTRFASGARTHYGASVVADDVTSIYKRVAGAFTGLKTMAHVWTNDNVLKISADGSSLASFDNGAALDTVTDVSISGNLRGGLAGRRDLAGVYADVFEYGDIAAPPSSLPVFINHYRNQGIM